MNLLYFIEHQYPTITQRSQNKLYDYRANAFTINSGFPMSCLEIRQAKDAPADYILTFKGIPIFLIRSGKKWFRYFIHRFDDPQKDLVFFLVTEEEGCIEVTEWSPV